MTYVSVFSSFYMVVSCQNFEELFVWLICSAVVPKDYFSKLIVCKMLTSVLGSEFDDGRRSKSNIISSCDSDDVVCMFFQLPQSVVLDRRVTRITL